VYGPFNKKIFYKDSALRVYTAGAISFRDKTLYIRLAWKQITENGRLRVYRPKVHFAPQFSFKICVWLVFTYLPWDWHQKQATTVCHMSCRWEDDRIRSRTANGRTGRCKRLYQLWRSDHSLHLKSCKLLISLLCNILPFIFWIR